MKVAVYCRVSTEDQADSKTIQNQVDFAHRYCSLHDMDIVDFYLDEGISGTIPVEKRPAGYKMMADVRKGSFHAVCVYRLDRLARTALEILRTHQILAERNVILKSMTENFDTSTPSGKFFMTTLGGIAEIERETISERMRLGKDRALREGRWPGGPPPYGYSLLDRKLFIDPEEASVVKQIFRLYSEGEMSTSLIAEYLNAIGIPAPGRSSARGSLRSKWHPSRVWSILSGTVYRGVFLYHQKRLARTVELQCPPVVSEKEWNAVLGKRKQNFADAKRNSKREYLLKGLIHCGECGRKYHGDSSIRKGNRFYYRCSGKGSTQPCLARSVRADIIEDLVWKDICQFVLSARHLIEHIRQKALSCPNSFEADSKASATEVMMKAKQKERKRIIDLYKKQIINEEELHQELDLINRELERIQRRGESAERPVFSQDQKADSPFWLQERLKSASCSEKRNLIRGLLDHLTVDQVSQQGKMFPRVTIQYHFEGSAGCILYVETRGKYRLGVPKPMY